MSNDKQPLGSAILLHCTCTHATQDRMYGAGKRVHNKYKDGYRCTVCSSTRTS